MNSLVNTLLQLSALGAALGLVLFCIKAAVKNKFSMRWHYFIWLVVIFRFLVPAFPEIGFISGIFVPGSMSSMYVASTGSSTFENNELVEDTVYGAETAVSTQASSGTANDDAAFYQTEIISEITASSDAYEGNSQGAAEQRSVQNGDIAYTVAKSGSNVSIQELLQLFAKYAGLVWLVGFMVSLGTSIVFYRRFLTNIKKHNVLVESEYYFTVLEQSKAAVGIKRDIQVYKNTYISTPILLGIFRPQIMLPHKQYPVDELDFIFRHELTHYKHFDLLIKWLANLAVAVHWFNPVVYIMRNEINKDCELCCDESVIRGLNKDERKLYGAILLNTAESSTHKNIHIVPALQEDKEILKQRLAQIIKFKKGSKLTTGVSVALCLCIATVGFLSGACFAVITKPELAATAVEEAFASAASSFSETVTESVSVYGHVSVTESVSDNEVLNTIQSASTNIRETASNWSDSIQSAFSNNNAIGEKVADSSGFVFQLKDMTPPPAASSGTIKYAGLFSNSGSFKLDSDTTLVLNGKVSLERGDYIFTISGAQGKVFELSTETDFDKEYRELTLKKGTYLYKLELSKAVNFVYDITARAKTQAESEKSVSVSVFQVSDQFSYSTEYQHNGSFTLDKNTEIILSGNILIDKGSLVLTIEGPSGNVYTCRASGGMEVYDKVILQKGYYSYRVSGKNVTNASFDLRGIAVSEAVDSVLWLDQMQFDAKRAEATNVNGNTTFGSELKEFWGYCVINNSSFKDYQNNTYSRGLQISENLSSYKGMLSFDINGTYSRLKGKAVSLSGSTNDGQITLKIYGDDKLLYTSEAEDIKYNTKPMEIDVDVSGCDTIIFELIKNGSQNGGVKLGLAEMAFYSTPKTPFPAVNIPKTLDVDVDSIAPGENVSLGAYSLKKGDIVKASLTWGNNGQLYFGLYRGNGMYNGYIQRKDGVIQYEQTVPEDGEYELLLGNIANNTMDVKKIKGKVTIDEGK